MYYIPYLVLKSQLVDRSRAKLIVEGVEVFIQASLVQTEWVLEAKIAFYSESLSDTLKENLSTLNYIKSKYTKAILKAFPEDGYVLISHKVRAITGYIEFKTLIEEFMSSYDFWKSVVEDVVKNEDLVV